MFSMISEFASSQLCNPVITKRRAWEVTKKVLAHQIWGKCHPLSTFLLFDSCMVFCDLYDCNDFPLINYVRFYRDLEQQWSFPWISGKPHDVKYSIWARRCDKNGGEGVPGHEQWAEPERGEGKTSFGLKGLEDLRIVLSIYTPWCWPRRIYTYIYIYIYLCMHI